MPNTYAATIDALAPDYDFLLDESSGNYLNNGGGGALQVPPQDNPWRKAPGVIRNSPWEFGLWGASAPSTAPYAGTAATGTITGYPAASGWNTGTFNCFIMSFSPAADTAEWTPLAVGYNTGSSIFEYYSARFLVDQSNGRLYFCIYSRIAGTIGSTSVRVFTNTGVIAQQTPYMITAVQRGDGTGIHIFVNGVDVTAGATYGGSSDVDTYIGDCFGGFSTNGPFALNAVGSSGTAASPGFDQNGHGIVQRPAIWRNTALTDEQVLELYTAANLDGTPQDYYEYMLDRFVETGLVEYMNLGWLGGPSTDAPMETGPIDTTVNHDRMNWASTRAATNTLETDRVTNYQNYKSRFGAAGGQYASSTNAQGFENLSVGTMNILVTQNTNLGFNDSDRRGVFNFGEGLASDDENMGIGFGGTVLGGTIIYTIGQFGITQNPTGNYYRRVFQAADGGFLPGNIPEFAMLTITQDGTGVKIYKNGTELTTYTESSSGVAYDENSWWADLITSEILAVGYPSSTSHVADLDVHHMFVLNEAMTGAQISELWDAINGIFPAAATPPDGGFNDTLTNTGNVADPNGPGPDHYWRMNAASGLPPDVGISVIDGTAITTGGDPTYEVQGPLIDDPTNEAIYFDGAGDYFEVGVDGIAGELCDYSIGTLGFFISINSLTRDHVVYSQSNDLATAYIQWGVDDAVPYFIVQTSAGNSVRMDATNAVDQDYVFVVMTNDGSNYLLYIDGVVDATAVVTETGTGVEGDWFDSITATRTAIAARADSSFTTETTARESEIFIYDEVLTAAQIAALFNAAQADGIGGAANVLGVVEFEDVIFRNGANADVKAINPRTDFNQVLKVSNSQFIGGLQGSAAQSILLSGETLAQVRGSTFDLGETPVAGRAAVHATVADPTASATTFGSLVVTDSTFNRMGRASDPAIYLEAGFGMTVEKSRFFDILGAAIGWRGDARKVIVNKNIIDTVTAAFGAIYVRAALNTQIGSEWLVAGNTISDVAAGPGIWMDGANSSLAEFARNLIVRRNRINNVADEAIYMDAISDAIISGNEVNGGATEGVRIKKIKGIISVQGNTIEDHSGEGIIMDETALQTAALSIARNTINGLLSGDGITVDNVTTARLMGNKLVNLVNGITLGDIPTALQFYNNAFVGVSVPLTVTGTLGNADFGKNTVASMTAVQALTVATNAIDVTGPYHVITSGSVTDLDTIGGPGRTGMVVALQMANGSSVITAKDGTGDMNLAGDYAMAADDILWLIYDGAAWNELSRT